MEELYNCPICIELCNDAIECLKCHKFFCREHVAGFRDVCPACRSSPFEYQSNIPINRMIEDLRIQQGKNTVYPCKLGQCKFRGKQSELAEHASKDHQDEIAKLCIKGGIEKQDILEKDLKKKNEEIDYLKIKIRNLEKQQQKPQEVQNEPPQLDDIPLPRQQIINQRNNRNNNQQQQNNDGLPGGQRKKYATGQQKNQMVQHINQCQHQQCHRLWSGPWGPFIGGKEGSTIFDLTQCQVGKDMNQAIGWNYSNPAF